MNYIRFAMGQAWIDSPKEILDKSAAFADKQIGRIDSTVKDITMIGQDTIRQGGTVIDNIRGDALSTARQFGSDTAAIVDSTIDNLNTTFNVTSVAFFDTIQMIAILTFAGVILFLMFYGDKIFANGIRLGKINLF